MRFCFLAFIIFATQSISTALSTVKLEEPGWNPFVKKILIEIIEAKKGQKLPVVFDFDNTLVCRDIGEATFAVMIRDGLLTAENLPQGTTPISVASGDLMAVYQTYLESSNHHVLDKAPYLNAYAWLVQIMAGLTPQQIVEKTSLAYQNGKAEHDMRHPESWTHIEKTPVPYFYPEMVELLGELLKADYDVWIISASNVWSVRWIVTQVLNKKLQERGVSNGIKPQQIIGISALLHGPKELLYKDPFLAIENTQYANLSAAVLS